MKQYNDLALEITFLEYLNDKHYFKSQDINMWIEYLDDRFKGEVVQYVKQWQTDLQEGEVYVCIKPVDDFVAGDLVCISKITEDNKTWNDYITIIDNNGNEECAGCEQWFRKHWMIKVD